MLSREKIIRALLDTAKLALFGHFDNGPDQAARAAEEDMASSERSVQAAIHDGRGNGSKRTIRHNYFNGYKKRMNELTR